MVWLRTNSGTRNSINIVCGLSVTNCCLFKKTFFRFFSMIFSVPNPSVACMDCLTNFLTIQRTLLNPPTSSTIASATTNGRVILKAGSVIGCCKFECWNVDDCCCLGCCWSVVDCCCLDYGGTVLSWQKQYTLTTNIIVFSNISNSFESDMKLCPYPLKAPFLICPIMWCIQSWAYTIFLCPTSIKSTSMFAANNSFWFVFILPVHFGTSK